MVITQFFSLTNQLPIWILLIFSIALISLGLEFKEHQEDFNKNLLPTLCLVGFLTLFVLTKNNIITNKLLILSFFVLLFIGSIFNLVNLWLKKGVSSSGTKSHKKKKE